MTPDSLKGPEREARTELAGIVEFAPGVCGVQLGEDVDWEAAAAWCGGTVEISRDHTDEYYSRIRIPRPDGSAVEASEPEWIVRYPGGEVRAVHPEAIPIGALFPRLWARLVEAAHDCATCPACDGDPNIACRDKNEAEANASSMLAVVRPELERLTAEVERLRKRVHDVADETQRRYAKYQSRCDQFDTWSKWARAEWDAHGFRWGMESEFTRLVVRSLLQERDALSGLLRGMARRVHEFRQAARAEADLLDEEQVERRATAVDLTDRLAGALGVGLKYDPLPFDDLLSMVRTIRQERNQYHGWYVAMGRERDDKQIEIERLRRVLARAEEERDSLRAQLDSLNPRYTAFTVGDLVRWSGDRWFEGRIVGETGEADRINGDERWSLEVTNLGTLYTGQESMLGRVVHAAEQRLTFLAGAPNRELVELRAQPGTLPSAAQWKDAQSEIKRLEENESFLESAVHVASGCCDGTCSGMDACLGLAVSRLYGRVRETLRGVSSSEAEAPGFVPACPACVRGEQHTIGQLQSFHRDGLELLAEAAEEARSAPSEASQHKVLIEHVWRDVYATWCRKCEAGVVGGEAKAEDWKDQHEAETLRPCPNETDIGPGLLPPVVGAAEPLSAVELIAAERARQVAVEGWTPEHDAEHDGDDLARAAACYALPAWCRHPVWAEQWPWAPEFWKPTHADRVRELVKAGALIAAEIDRLQRQDAASAAEAEPNLQASSNLLQGLEQTPASPATGEADTPPQPRVWRKGAPEPIEDGLLLRSNICVWERGADGLWRSGKRYRNGALLASPAGRLIAYEWPTLSSCYDLTEVLPEVSSSPRERGGNSG